MSNIDLGAPVTAVWAGAPTGGTYAVAITRPDGTTFTPPAVTAGPPVSVTFTPDMAGRWVVRWTSSVKPGAYVDVLNVWPNDPRAIISLDDAKSALNMGSVTDPALLDDLRLYIVAATPVIEDIAGVTVSKTITQIADGNRWAIALYEKPVTIVSITEIGNPVTEYVVDYQTGMLYAGKTFALRRWQPGFQTVVITYTAGSNQVPDNIRLATRELVRHWWQLGKQGTRSGANSGSFPATADAWTPSGFAVPRRVIELASVKVRQLGGFA